MVIGFLQAVDEQHEGELRQKNEEIQQKNAQLVQILVYLAIHPPYNPFLLPHASNIIAS